MHLDFPINGVSRLPMIVAPTVLNTSGALRCVTLHATTLRRGRLSDSSRSPAVAARQVLRAGVARHSASTGCCITTAGCCGVRCSTEAFA